MMQEFHSTNTQRDKNLSGYNNTSGVLNFINLHSVNNFFVQLLSLDRLLGEKGIEKPHNRDDS